MELELGRARIHISERPEGDFRIPAGPVVDRPWRTAKQVHGARVAVVDRACADPGEADALVTTDPSIAVAVRTADCAPVLLVATGGVAAVGAIHAGWRGLFDGVVERGVEALVELGGIDVQAVIGPAIGPECYEFSPADLDAVAARYGDGVRGRTRAGTPALDLVAGVRAALANAGVADAAITQVGTCTACDADRWFSHRARSEAERMASAIWLHPEPFGRDDLGIPK